MNIEPVGWGVLAASILVAVLLDLGVLWAGLEYLKPPSKSVFVVARVAKLLGLIGWVLFLSLVWYPTYVEKGAPLPQMWKLGLAGLIVVVALVAGVSFPRPSAARASAARGPRNV